MTDEPANMQVNGIASHPTMSILVTAHEDSFIRIWDSVTGAYGILHLIVLGR